MLSCAGIRRTTGLFSIGVSGAATAPFAATASPLCIPAIVKATAIIQARLVRGIVGSLTLFEPQSVQRQWSNSQLRDRLGLPRINDGDGRGIQLFERWLRGSPRQTRRPHC